MAEYDAQPGRPYGTPDPELSPTQLEADDVDLNAGLIGVARIVAGGRGVVDLLGDVAQFAVHAIPGVDGAGVTADRIARRRTACPSVGRDGRLRPGRSTPSSTKSSTGGRASRARSRGGRRVSGSLGSDARWPHFGGRVARMGVHSVLSLPLIVDDRVVGAINAYARSRDAFTEHAVTLGSQFAGPAAVSVYNAQLLATGSAPGRGNFSVRWPAGSLIDQAIGILAQPVGCQRTGGIRSALPGSARKRTSSCTSSPSRWWRRPCGAHVLRHQGS